MRFSIPDQVSSYYSTKLSEHGTTAKGVDWNNSEGQELRFRQIARLLPDETEFEVADLGCGYGAFIDYLDTHRPGSRYVGYDLSPDMIDAARSGYAERKHTEFHVGGKPHRESDYCVASGIFNVRFSVPDSEWRDWFEEILHVMNRCSRHGFAFNALTVYSDAEKRQDRLFYLDPGEVFGFCVKHFSRHVALLQDYGMYEFTIIVRK